jgi:hypothetical protein
MGVLTMQFVPAALVGRGTCCVEELFLCRWRVSPAKRGVSDSRRFPDSSFVNNISLRSRRKTTSPTAHHPLTLTQDQEQIFCTFMSEASVIGNFVFPRDLLNVICEQSQQTLTDRKTGKMISLWKMKP